MRGVLAISTMSHHHITIRDAAISSFDFQQNPGRPPFPCILQTPKGSGGKVSALRTCRSPKHAILYPFMWRRWTVHTWMWSRVKSWLGWRAKISSHSTFYLVVGISDGYSGDQSNRCRCTKKGCCNTATRFLESATIRQGYVGEWGTPA